MNEIPSASTDLVVTSPPYPMIKMWDDGFSRLNPLISEYLNKGQGIKAFELMHKELDSVWKEVRRILKNGGFVCINIGDAVRTLKGNFMLYPNHSRIMTFFLKKGFTALPEILWRKQTNAPNKFMGSGMLPIGAYVTLEHEYILILRKGHVRVFSTEAEKRNRRESAFFWEERNSWYSDIWFNIKGAQQKMGDKMSLRRSAAYPFEIPYRLINMLSVKGDTVVDPFSGTGTTMAAAMASCRNSIGYESDGYYRKSILSRFSQIVDFSNKRMTDRLDNHINFLMERVKKKGAFKHSNMHYKFPVMTNHERQLLLNPLVSCEKQAEDVFETVYSEEPSYQYDDVKGNLFCVNESLSPLTKKNMPSRKKAIQLKLLD